MRLILSGIFTLFFINLYCQVDFQQVLQDCHDANANETNIRQRQKKTENCLLGNQFPNFQGKTITGEEFDLKDNLGSVVVINLWFRKCRSCIAEMPGLNKLYDYYKPKGVKFISLATDDTPMIEYMLEEEREFKLDIIPNAKEIIYHDLNLSFGFPTTIILDKEGVIRYFNVGGMGRMSSKEEVFNSLAVHLQLCL